MHKPKDHPDGELSARERDVVWLFAEGHTAADIATKLSLSPAVVEEDRANAMRKLALHTETELVRYVLQRSVRGADS